MILKALELSYLNQSTEFLKYFQRDNIIFNTIRRNSKGGGGGGSRKSAFPPGQARPLFGPESIEVQEYHSLSWASVERVCDVASPSPLLTGADKCPSPQQTHRLLQNGASPTKAILQKNDPLIFISFSSVIIHRRVGSTRTPLALVASYLISICSQHAGQAGSTQHKAAGTTQSQTYSDYR